MTLQTSFHTVLTGRVSRTPITSGRNTSGTGSFVCQTVGLGWTVEKRLGRLLTEAIPWETANLVMFTGGSRNLGASVLTSLGYGVTLSEIPAEQMARYMIMQEMVYATVPHGKTGQDKGDLSKNLFGLNVRVSFLAGEWQKDPQKERWATANALVAEEDVMRVYRGAILVYLDQVLTALCQTSAIIEKTPTCNFAFPKALAMAERGLERLREGASSDYSTWAREIVPEGLNFPLPPS